MNSNVKIGVLDAVAAAIKALAPAADQNNNLDLSCRAKPINNGTNVAQNNPNMMACGNDA
jgi:hypothetical protein